MSINLSCPQVFLDGGGELPIVHLDVDVSVTVTVATVQIRSIFQNQAPYPVHGIYKCPNSYGRASISSCEISYPGRRIVTSVINPDIVTSVQPNSNPKAEAFDPLAFSMGCENCPPQSDVIITVTYLQDMEFNGSGQYELVVPSCVPNSLISSASTSYRDLCNIHCVLDVGTRQCQWSSNSHPMAATRVEGPCVSLESQPFTRTNAYFHIQYFAYSENISGTCLMQQAPQLQEGSFVTFLSPPTTCSPDSIVGRDMVFLLDRSGSMTGRPLAEAKKALTVAITSLHSQDKFAICAFDDLAEWYGGGDSNSPVLLDTGPHNIARACEWVECVQSRGTTDILSPYKTATKLLNKKEKSAASKSSSVAPAALANLAVIVLITDGAVPNELEICNFAQQQMESSQKSNFSTNAIRTFTFGIGPYVNQYFLKTLASNGRGYAHICLHQDQIETTMIKLLNKSQKPLLVNIYLDIPKQAGVLHTSPSICPDLYHGCPVVLAGRFMGNDFPRQISATGIDSTGQLIRILIDVRPPYTNGKVDLGVAYAVSFLDSQISEYWVQKQMGNSRAAEAARDRAIATSMESSVPCVFTKAVAYDTTPQQAESKQQNVNKKGENKGMSNKSVVAGSGLMLLAVTAGSVLMFGNVAATSNNLSVSNVLDSLSSMSVDASMLHGVVDSLSTAARGLGQAAGDFGGIVGNGFDSATNGLSAAGAAAGHGLQSAARNMGEVGGQVGDVAGKGLGAVSTGIGNAAGGNVNNIGQGIGQMGGNIGQAATPAVQNISNGIEGVGGGCDWFASCCDCDELQRAMSFIMDFI